jgi:hypothetical protein
MNCGVQTILLIHCQPSGPNNSNEPCTLSVWADQSVLGSIEKAQQKLKYATFGDVFYQMFISYFKLIMPKALK